MNWILSLLNVELKSAVLVFRQKAVANICRQMKLVDREELLFIYGGTSAKPRE